MRKTVEIHGSHGTFIVDRATGIILELRPVPMQREDIRDGETGYIDIRLFDITPFMAYPDVDRFDILACGFWDKDGDYATPLTPYSSWEKVSPSPHDRRHEWSTWNWREIALLPAPEKEGLLPC